MKHIKIILAALLAITLTACSDTNTAEDTTLMLETTSDTFLTEENSTTTEAAESVTTASESTNEETVTTLEEVTTVSETEAAEINVDYKKDYAEYLNNQTFWTGGLYIGDINGDGIPEAVIETNVCEDTIILYYNEDGMQELWLATMSAHGYVRHIPDENMIAFSPWFDRGFADDVNVYQWTGNAYEIVYTVSGSIAAYGEDMAWANVSTETEGMINGEEVSPEEFEAAYHKLEKLWEDYEYFPVISVNDENFESYVKENLPEFNNWDIIQK